MLYYQGGGNFIYFLEEAHVSMFRSEEQSRACGKHHVCCTYQTMNKVLMENKDGNKESFGILKQSSTNKTWHVLLALDHVNVVVSTESRDRRRNSG